MISRLLIVSLLIVLGVRPTSGDGFVASTRKVPFHELTDQKQLSYLQYMTTRLPSTGYLKAPLPIVMFAPGDCTECAIYYSDVITRLVIGSRQKVLFSYASLPTESASSISASTTAICADQQDRLWDYLSFVAHQKTDYGLTVTDVTMDAWEYRSKLKTPIQARLTPEQFEKLRRRPRVQRKIGETFGLDIPKFIECHSSGKAQAILTEHKFLMDELEIDTLPTIYIGTTMVIGLPGYRELEKMVDRELKKGLRK